MAIELPDAVKPVLNFAIQVVVGAFACVVVLFAAVLLAAVIRLISMIPWAPDWLINAAEWTERGVFAVDLIAFGLFLLAEVIKLARGLWKEIKRV